MYKCCSHGCRKLLLHMYIILGFICMIWISSCVATSESESVIITRSPAGTPVEGLNNTFVYPVFTTVNLTCSTIPAIAPSSVRYLWSLHTRSCASCYGGQEQSIIIENLTRDDAGLCTCITYRIGEYIGYSSITLYVSYVPSIVNAIVLTPHSVKVTWDACALHTSVCTEVNGYLISYCSTDSCASIRSAVVGNGTNHTISYTITNLQEYTQYNITVHATNRNWMIIANSSVVFVRTYAAAPSSPPQSVQLSAGVDRTSMNVTWKPPPPIDQNGPLVNYSITYHRTGSVDTRSVNVTVDVTQYILSSLTPFVSYSVQIAAVNTNGTGPLSPVVTRVLDDQYCDAVTVDYSGFNITWNTTRIDNAVEVPCTGHGLNGSVWRRCISDNVWEEFITGNCFKAEIRILENQAINLLSSLNKLNEIDIVTTMSNIASVLVDVTTPREEPLFAQDINLAVDLISTLNNITETVVANLTVTPNAFFEDCTTVLDNLLSDINKESWEQLQYISPSTSQDLLRGAEQVAKLLSETLTNSTTKATKTRPNIVIKAEKVSGDSVYGGYVFPDETDNSTIYAGGNAKLMIPSSLLRNITAGYKELTIAITLISNNTGLRLPSATEGTNITNITASSIFSLQINPSPDLSTLVNSPIMMAFDVSPTAEQIDDQGFTVDDVSCNFYDYDSIASNDLNQTGGWSTEGLSVDKSNSNTTLVTCLTTHLTSFAVLVSIQDERPPSTADKALSLVSYIGCYISLTCLCVSIILLSYTIFRAKEDKNHLFIHLNLCIALALGIVAFITGIENATGNKIGCKITAALLQYLFTSAFCWMLCEGVFVYMKLVTVFSNKLNNRCFFFILGWGPAIPVVAISVGITHKHYGTDYYCWIKPDDGAIAAFIAPIVTIILINSIFLAMALVVVWKHRTRKQVVSNKSTVKSLLKAVLILSPLLGVTWIIGMFAINNETQMFAWIFAILNSLQACGSCSTSDSSRAKNGINTIQTAHSTQTNSSDVNVISNDIYDDTSGAGGCLYENIRK